MFKKLKWYTDKMILNNINFRLPSDQIKDAESGDNCFIFRKTKRLIDQYERFWLSKSRFKPKNIIEIGIYDGGSIVFWFEYFHPDKHIGVDIRNREDSKYFQDYVKSNDLEKRIKTFWKTNQADHQRLVEIVNTEFDSPIDLIIDDASHMYELTKSSFQTLFPLLRPGGLYIIEDWAWAHWEEFQQESHPWSAKTALTKLIFELVEATGSSTDLIKSLTIYQGFAVAERGEAAQQQLKNFDIGNWISRKPTISAVCRILNKIRHITK